MEAVEVSLHFYIQFLKLVHNSNEYFKLNEHGLNELLNSHGGQPYKNIFLIIHNPTNKTLNKVIEKLKK